MSQVIVPDGSNLHKQKKGTVLTIQNHTENTFGCVALSCEQGFGVSKDAPRSDVRRWLQGKNKTHLSDQNNVPAKGQVLQ